MRPSRFPQFDYACAILKEGKLFVGLCLDLDVASQGRTVRQAKQMLAEAVTLYLESCLENNIPPLRPVPRLEDPRYQDSPTLVEIFSLKADFSVRAVA
jgi:predicted RNase H-like HicB family nuclease